MTSSSSDTGSRNLRRELASAAILAAAFFAVAAFSLTFTKEHGRLAAVWPANALLLVALLRAPRGGWAMRIAAAWLGNVAAAVATGNSLALYVVLASLNSVEVLVCVLTMASFAGRTIDLTQPRQLAIFGLAATLTGPLLSALVAAGYLHAVRAAPYMTTLAVWWPAHVLGMLIFAPALLILADGSGRRLLQRAMWPRTLAMAALLAVALVVVFNQHQLPLLFVISPILVLITFRLGLAGAAWGILATAAYSITALLLRSGPTILVGPDLAARAQMLQLFLAFQVAATLPLASILGVQQRLEASLLAARNAAHETAEALGEANAIAAVADGMAGLGYWLYRPATRETVWSDEMYRIHGLEPADGVPDFDLVANCYHPDDQSLVREFALRSLQTGEDYRLELRVLREGETRLVIGATTCQRAPDGSILALVGTVMDVTDLRKIETALVESEGRFRTLADAIPDMILRTDRTGVIVYASPASRQFGYEPDDLVGRRTLEFVHPDDLEATKQRSVVAYAGGEIDRSVRREQRVRMANGDWVWLESKPTQVRDSAGELVEIVNAFRDVTLRRALEDKISESEAHLRTLAEAIPDMVLRMTPDGVITYVTPACRQYGYEPEMLVGRRAVEFIHPEDLAASNERRVIMFSPAEIARNIRRETRIRTADGGWVWLEGSPTQVRDASGQVVEIVNAFRDVTQRRALEDELLEARVVAERSTAAKADFLSNMSHELRTPLTAIVGFAGLLKGSGQLGDREKMFADRVATSSHTLLTLVNDILDFSKMEAGGVVLESLPVDVDGLVDQSVAMVSGLAEKKGLALSVTVDDDLPTFVGDPSRLRQVLVNLLSNAVKFTAQGGVALSIGHAADGSIRFDVSDTGVGIPAERIDQIFERFTQADGSTTRTHGGTGLGLAICKGLVDSMGGTILVRSQLGVGSTFAFTLPASCIETADTRSVA